MKKIFNIFILAATLLMVACQQNHYDVQPMQISAPERSLFHENIEGNSYTITWDTPKDTSLYLCYAYYVNGSQREKMTPDTEYKNKFVIESTETQQEYEIVFKYCTKKDMLDGAMSLGTVFTYTRGGAGKVTDLTVTQVENADGTNTAIINWSPVATATSYELTVNVYDKKDNLLRCEKDKAEVTETHFEFPAAYGEKWDAQVLGVNKDGKSLSAEASMLMGKTKNAFFSLYPTVADLMANGDDDEQAAWLLLQEKFPKMQYLYLGDIAENPDLLEPLRMGFFIRDTETDVFDDVWGWGNLPECAQLAAPVIGNWVRNGGNLCLWSHACTYIGWIERIPSTELGLRDKWDGRISGNSKGFSNGDEWNFGLSHCTDQGFTVHHNDHPLYRGIAFTNGWEGRARKMAEPCIGPGWKEDHNCGWFDRPGWWTGEPNNTQACYDKLVMEFGITPLGTWDGDQCQWISQLLVWEAGPAETPNPMFEGNSWEGTVLCVGNGGFEIAQNKPDGSKDINRTTNPHQNVIDKLVENAVNYLMSK